MHFLGSKANITQIRSLFMLKFLTKYRIQVRFIFAFHCSDVYLRSSISQEEVKLEIKQYPLANKEQLNRHITATGYRIALFYVRELK